MAIPENTKDAHNRIHIHIISEEIHPEDLYMQPWLEEESLKLEEYREKYRRLVEGIIRKYGDPALLIELPPPKLGFGAIWRYGQRLLRYLDLRGIQHLRNDVRIYPGDSYENVEQTGFGSRRWKALERANNRLREYLRRSQNKRWKVLLWRIFRPSKYRKLKELEALLRDPEWRALFEREILVDDRSIKMASKIKEIVEKNAHDAYIVTVGGAHTDQIVSWLKKRLKNVEIFVHSVP